MFTRLIFLSSALLLSACASTPTTFDETFSRIEIADMTSDYFDLEAAAAAARALKPTYAKYGAPHIYVSGLMSAAASSGNNRLHGTGMTSAKLATTDNVYWAIQGSNLPTQTRPLKTAHLIYNKIEIENLEEALTAVGSLSKRGQIFTVFEREIDGQIVVTLNLTDDLPKAAQLKTIYFSPL